MKTTLILNGNIKSYHQRKTFWEIFAQLNFVIVLLAAQVNRKIESDIEFSAVIKLPRCVYSRNSEESVSNDGKISSFCFC